MKKYLLLQLFLFLFVLVTAQPKSSTVPDKEFGEKGTKTVTKSTDEGLSEVIKVEWKDDGGVVRKKYIRKKNIDGTSSIEIECLSPSGRTQYKVIYTLDKDKKIVKRDNQGFNKSGNRNIQIVSTRNEKGELINNGEIKESVNELIELEDAFEKYFDDLEKNIEPLVSSLPSCSNKTDGSSCAAKFEIFGGYSYLNSEFGNDRESYPLGVHASFNYAFAPRFSAGIDASLHTKKDGDLTLNRGFILLEGMYVLGNVNNCDRKLIPNVHLLAGLACEKLKYNSGTFTSKTSGSGFAYGGGVGLDVNVSKKLAIRLFQADYILTRFNDESIGNIRVSAGVRLGFGYEYNLKKRTEKYLKEISEKN